eukprot:TRINITY_DN18842_c1_g7_i3.p1 TRINITY_DN18842_c1_g7~~TRINITY_DN18842_c1_g7_i3.p1  ORF type:complete len:397 (-),score=91.18 TRINITY_DN18842_c1_g7_i3:152-1342(-)
MVWAFVAPKQETRQTMHLAKIVGIGFSMHAAPVYIAETAPAHVRGALVSGKEAIIVLGVFLGYIAGFAFSGLDVYGWRFMVLISLFLALVLEFGLNFIAESPRILLLRALRSGTRTADGEMQPALDEARAALRFYRRAASADAVQAELSRMASELEASMADEKVTWTEAFKYPRPLLIGFGLVVLQQVTGQPSVLYNATSIFKAAGFGNSAVTASVGIGAIKLVATLFTVWRVDEYGRRLLLFIGIAMMTLAAVVLGIGFLNSSCAVPVQMGSVCPSESVILSPTLGAVMVAGLGLFVTGYQVGFGPITWLMMSEVFPLRVRNAALSLVVMTNFVFNILTTATLTVMQEALTPGGLFLAYSAMCVVSIFFVAFVVPETKGKTLEEIEQMLSVSAKK